MVIYLAASSAEMDRVRAVVAMVEEYNKTAKPAAKIELAARWWDVISARGDANPVDAPFHERLKYANDDLDGVRQAEVLWLLFPGIGRNSIGCFWEAGVADERGTEIVISGPGQERSIFTARGSSYAEDASAFEYLASLAHWDTVHDAPTGEYGAPV